jgi:hypothetical protein
MHSSPSHWGPSLGCHGGGALTARDSASEGASLRLSFVHFHAGLRLDHIRPLAYDVGLGRGVCDSVDSPR